ncbi:MAG: hypothetical protein JW720_09830, partial [Sedimentisphaerales bacterium]|nr:hypothetical protein [Sedimentisphaerales bacterium]
GETMMQAITHGMVLMICLVCVTVECSYGWCIGYTHPALTQYAEAGSKLDAYCAKLLIDKKLTWDFNEWDSVVSLHPGH